MEVIANILQALFEHTELDPEIVCEIELVAGCVPLVWYLHVQPGQGWFAEVSYDGEEWGVVLYDYL
jgi:hypothetical protein